MVRPPENIAVRADELRLAFDHSASYNETVEPSFAETVAIYRAAGAPVALRFVVSEGRRHEMDLPALVAFMNGETL